MEPISVVIPTFNRAKLLARALASVCEATEARDEIIVADDGSTDNTGDVVNSPEMPWRGRVRYLLLARGGAGRARNAGVAAARHDLIAFADSDDLWLPFRLALERQVLESDPGLAFCFSDFGQILANGENVSHWVQKWSEDARPWDVILAPGRAYAERWPLPRGLPESDARFRFHVGSMYARELHANYINVNTLLVRRSAVGDALRFAEDLPLYEDWECFARICGKGDCAYLDVDTAIQCSHSGPRLTDAGRLDAATARLKVIERTWASDPAFMRSHGEDVRRLVGKLQRTMLRQLILLDRREEARALADLCNGAWLERLAMFLPKGLLQVLRRRA